MKTRGFRILGAALAALLPACGGGGNGTGNPAFAVTIMEPSAGQTFTAPATISVSAVAADPASIAQVEFFQGHQEFELLASPDTFNPSPDQVVGTSTQPPFQVTWTDVPAGIHTLVARATDTLGTQTFSNTVTITVLPPGAAPGGWVAIARVPRGSGIWFVDANRGWVVGPRGTIMHTVDGGATWVLQTRVEGTLSKIQFVDANRGWAVGDFGQGVLRTTDGGATWTPSLPGTSLQALSFVDSNTGWAVGLGDNVFATTDGGVTWTPQPTRIPGNDLNQGVRFVDRLNGWVLGVVESTQDGVTELLTVVLHTTDGGQTWTEQLRRGPIENLLALDFVSATTGWVSRNGGILFTSDGGATWTEQILSEDLLMWALDFVSPTLGWGVGSRGRESATIIQTENGGGTWTEQQGGLEDTRFLDVRFIDANRGWAIGRDGLVVKTTTGGKAP